ncbi:hypothetical protein [Brooklawnia sp.]|uniref:hypothetical protein n=1 Tax=Brooklawnia sp. TaxID=2699740 RepID=UPI003120160F
MADLIMLREDHDDRYPVGYPSDIQIVQEDTSHREAGQLDIGPGVDRVVGRLLSGRRS